MYVLDTDVVSQITKRPPHPKVAAWILSQDENKFFLSVVTLLEIRRGVNLLPEGKKRTELEQWLTVHLPLRMNGRFLAIDHNVADLAGSILARSKREGWEIKNMDSLIAATAMAYDMELATLNRKHFERIDVKLVDFP